MPLLLLKFISKKPFLKNIRGNKIYEPPRYMTVNQAIQQLLEIEEVRQEKGNQSSW